MAQKKKSILSLLLCQTQCQHVPIYHENFTRNYLLLSERYYILNCLVILVLMSEWCTNWSVMKDDKKFGESPSFHVVYT